MSTKIYTAESVSAQHPDKICDGISDAVLDAALSQDPASHVACETFATKGLIVIGGEITTKAKLDYPAIVREAAKRLDLDFTGTELYVAVHEQSLDISEAVTGGGETGAGDQGIMIGYATNETPEYLPVEFAAAKAIIRKIDEVRKSGEIRGIKGDAKSQVSAEFEDGVFTRFTQIVVSVQHDEGKDLDELRAEITDKVIRKCFSLDNINGICILINPSGRFVLGGIDADTGLTGRKIVCDAYGPRVPVGGGAFSGKDATKVDRSGAYYARYVAKNVVAAGLADKCQLQIAYAIGKAYPVAVNLDTFGTAKGTTDEAILQAVLTLFDFRPASIVRELDLTKPVYAEAASYGHFGNEIFTWEKTDKANERRTAVLSKGA